MSVKHADKAPAVPMARKTFWRLPKFLPKGPGYKTLVNSDRNSSKATLDSETSDIPEDAPLLKVGASDAAAENRKYGRSQSVEEEEEPDVPRPHSKVMFSLPDKSKGKAKDFQTPADEPTNNRPDSTQAANGNEQTAAVSNTALIGTGVQPPIAGTDIQPVAPSNDKVPDVSSNFIPSAE